MRSIKSLLTLIITSLSFYLGSQEVPILDYTVDHNGRVQLKVASTQDNYYILNIRHNPSGDFELSTSLTLGEAGTTLITEPLGNYPLEYYQVLEYLIAEPIDTDGDGTDDVTEFYNTPTQSPFNNAKTIDIVNGTVCINSLITFKKLSITKEDFPFAEFLEDKAHAKFIIEDFNSDKPKIYFINGKTHSLHKDFANSVGVDILNDEIKKGEIIYHPTTVSNNGILGAFSFNYSNGHGQPFKVVQRCHELIAANMPFLRNNLSYFITPLNEMDYEQDQDLFQNSRVPILFEADVYADIDYLALNIAEGFGFFRQLSLDETPGSRDIVLYESIPNILPRVGGIMTSYIQTPLSHVNLKAIQAKIPNAFIRDPLSIDSIANLLDHYVYYKVEQDKFFIREATLDEVNHWYENIRPNKKQTPALNLSYTSILPLDEIGFEMSDGYGSKCTNVATMRTFGFPDGTIPNGFGVPFYFYQEFMKYNGFFNDVATMLVDPQFQSDRGVRIEMLEDFQKRIRKADMPQWMLNELQDMQESFPEGISIRCRSSSNNEDLPGFSGAGLYTSKTQHPDEGHISKSIKQVYAGLWNFRAFDERAFFRVDHYFASMGVLCHASYKDEKANGVGVSTDPIYQTENTFYLNTQLGDDLVTNPDAFSVPEEILLDKVPATEDDYIVIRRSNLLAPDKLIMEEKYLDQMRDYLSVIHDEFAILYEAVGNDEFAMDIEYKITKEDKLIIKQARPWASYGVKVNSYSVVKNDPNLRYYPNPVGAYLNIQCDNCDFIKVRITNLMGQQILELPFNHSNNSQVQIYTGDLTPGIYFIGGYRENNSIYFSTKFVK